MLFSKKMYYTTESKINAFLRYVKVKEIYHLLNHSNEHKEYLRQMENDHMWDHMLERKKDFFKSLNIQIYLN
jgi:predicted nucleotidyltransferase